MVNWNGMKLRELNWNGQNLEDSIELWPNLKGVMCNLAFFVLKGGVMINLGVTFEVNFTPCLDKMYKVIISTSF